MEWSLTGLPLPITLRPLSPFTDDELLEFSRKNEPYRIERMASGELSIMTPVGGRGSRRENFVGRELDYFAEEQGGVAFNANAGFNLPDGSTLAPDAAWLSSGRWDTLTSAQQEKYVPLCPEFVVEILSESDSLKSAQAKMNVWLANGTQLAWLIDPYAATITIYRPNREPETLHKPDSIEAEAPVAGFRLTTSRLWASA